MSEVSPQSNDPLSVNHENLVLGSSTYYSATRSIDGECETVQDTAAVSSSLPQLSFIQYVAWFMTLYISGLYFNDFLFVYAYSSITNSLHEGRMDSPVLVYTVKNLRKPGHTHVISRSIFAINLGRVAPLKTGWRCPTGILTDLVDIRSYIKVCSEFSLIC